MTDTRSPCCDAAIEHRGLLRSCARCGTVWRRNGLPVRGWSYPRFDPDGHVLQPLKPAATIESDTP